MPWPATHVLIAEKTFDRHFHHLDWGAFVLGNCFPDIRYLAKTERERTHFNHLTLEETRLQPAFLAGVHFHSLTDSAWNTHIHQHHDRLFSVVPHNLAMLHTLKILQDKYLYHTYGGWGQVSELFGEILPEEGAFGISAEILQGWHALLAGYLGKPPRYDDLDMLNLTLPGDLVREIRQYYLAYQDHPILQEIMIGFYAAAEQLLEQVIS